MQEPILPSEKTEPSFNINPENASKLLQDVALLVRKTDRHGDNSEQTPNGYQVYACSKKLIKNTSLVSFIGDDIPTPAPEYIEDVQDGFEATAYRNEHTGDIYIVMSGTDFTSPKRAVQNGVDDLKIALACIPSSYPHAEKFVKSVRNKAVQEFPGKPPVILAIGYSKSGVDAQILSVKHGIPSISYDPPGALEMLPVEQQSLLKSNPPAHILHVVGSPNPINTTGTRIGHTIYLSDLLKSSSSATSDFTQSQDYCRKNILSPVEFYNNTLAFLGVLERHKINYFIDALGNPSIKQELAKNSANAKIFRNFSDDAAKSIRNYSLKMDAASKLFLPTQLQPVRFFLDDKDRRDNMPTFMSNSSGALPLVENEVIKANSIKTNATNPSIPHLTEPSKSGLLDQLTKKNEVLPSKPFQQTERGYPQDNQKKETDLYQPRITLDFRQDERLKQQYQDAMPLQKLENTLNVSNEDGSVKVSFTSKNPKVVAPLAFALVLGTKLRELSEFYAMSPEQKAEYYHEIALDHFRANPSEEMKQEVKDAQLARIRINPRNQNIIYQSRAILYVLDSVNRTLLTHKELPLDNIYRLFDEECSNLYQSIQQNFTEINYPKARGFSRDLIKIFPEEAIAHAWHGLSNIGNNHHIAFAEYRESSNLKSKFNFKKFPEWVYARLPALQTVDEQLREDLCRYYPEEKYQQKLGAPNIIPLAFNPDDDPKTSLCAPCRMAAHDQPCKTTSNPISESPLAQYFAKIKKKNEDASKRRDWAEMNRASVHHTQAGSCMNVMAENDTAIENDSSLNRETFELDLIESETLDPCENSLHKYNQSRQFMVEGLRAAQNGDLYKARSFFEQGIQSCPDYKQNTAHLAAINSQILLNNVSLGIQIAHLSLIVVRIFFQCMNSESMESQQTIDSSLPDISEFAKLADEPMFIPTHSSKKPSKDDKKFPGFFSKESFNNTPSINLGLDHKTKIVFNKPFS